MRRIRSMSGWTEDPSRADGFHRPIGPTFVWRAQFTGDQVSATHKDTI
jgi:hypothetical protein